MSIKRIESKKKYDFNEALNKVEEIINPIIEYHRLAQDDRVVTALTNIVEELKRLKYTK